MTARAAVEPELGAHEARLLRATQGVRVHQSHRTLPIVLLTGAIFLASLWDEAPVARLGAWIGLIFAAALVRTAVCRAISRALEAADAAALRRFERRLFATAILNSAIIGSGFWWVGLEGSERAVFVVTLACCFYAIGSMINASVQFSGFVPMIAVNLGQGIAFFSGLGGGVEPAVAILLTGMLLLLAGFGRENARAFADSVSMREENLMLVEQLEAEKQTVESALAAAREANASKSRFLAAASHDLRQPLHALSLFLGSLSLLVRGEEEERLVRRIGETTDVLRDQFNALLDLSRFDAGGVAVEPADFRLDVLLDRVVEELRPEAERKGLAIGCEAPAVSVRSDRLLVERVVRNLVANAARYTAEGGVTVRAGAEGERVRVVVADTGPGITAEDQARVFEDFVQLHNPARNREQGIGLGLSIVRRIDRLLGLDLRLRSGPERGTEFEFRLPLAQPMADAAPADAAPALARGLDVWAVDDDAAVGEALCGQLRSWGCRPLLAASRGELERAIADGAAWPDVALVDDMLADGASGLDVAEWLGVEIGRERVLMITGNTAPGRIDELRARGFEVLVKPAPPEDLRRLIGERAGPRPTHPIG